ncbi:MAG: MFS transporter [Acidimicrobiaceae bacterium]|nr:MFS transporter [Acidimicrobiaceae bacterium]
MGSELIGKTSSKTSRSLVVLCLTFFLVSLDNTIVNVALPTLQRSLGASTTSLQWITDSYTTAFASLIVVGGYLADRHGRRVILQSGLTSFIVGSIVAILSSTSTVVILGRVLMGIGAAISVPSSLSMLVDVFHTARAREGAIAGWTASAGIGVALGPLAGGILLKYFWWGSIFLASALVAVAALAVSWFWLPKSPHKKAERFDWWGSILTVIILLSLVTGIIEGPDWGWLNFRVLALFALSLIGIVLFVWHARTFENPIVDLSILASRRFSMSSLAMGATYLCIFGFLFLMTQFLQGDLGMTPLQAGIHFLPAAGAVVVGSALAKAFGDKIGPKVVLTIGMFLLVVVNVQEIGFRATSNYSSVISILLTGGLAMGLILTVGTDEVMGVLPSKHLGTGAAVNVALMEIGGAIGVALYGSVFNSEYASILKSTSHLLPPALARLVVGSFEAGLAIAHRIGGSLALLLNLKVRGAFMSGYASAGWIGIAAGAVVVLVVAVLMPRRSIATLATDPEAPTAGGYSVESGLLDSSSDAS